MGHQGVGYLDLGAKSEVDLRQHNTNSTVSTFFGKRVQKTTTNWLIGKLVSKNKQ